MSEARAATQTSGPPSLAAARGKLFKADYARAIDWYIDYFGRWAGAEVAAENDPCGESLLDALTAREIRPCGPVDVGSLKTEREDD